MGPFVEVGFRNPPFLGEAHELSRKEPGTMFSKPFFRDLSAIAQAKRFGDNLSGPVRDTPPYRAIPFRDSVAEGGIAPICLVFCGYRASIAEIPLLRGGIAAPLCMLSKGETLRKGGIAPIWPC